MLLQKLCRDILASGNSHGLPGYRQFEALQILGGSGYQRGVEVQEVGGNCASFECRYAPEVNEGLPGIGGETFVRAKSTKFMREVTLEAEVAGATGIMTFSLVTNCTVANDTNTFGDGSGSLLLDEVTETQGRTAWRSVNIKLTSNPNLTLGA